MDTLHSISVFHQVVKKKSFAKAAEYFGTTQPTVSKHINQLEESLGTRLISRSTKQLKLTDKGNNFYTKTLKLVEEWEKIKGQTSEQEGLDKKAMKILVGTGTNHKLFLPILSEFLRNYPEMNLSIAESNMEIDIIQEEFDLFITPFFMKTNKFLMRKEITILEYVIVASPEYITENPIINNLNDLSRQNCIHDASSNNSAYWEFDGGKSIKINGNIEADNLLTISEMAEMGLGVAYLPRIYIAKELNRGSLKIILPEYKSSSIPGSRNSKKFLYLYAPYHDLKEDSFTYKIYEFVKAYVSTL
jgi:LysR family transcriptional regulator for bpeEF and oprC